MHKIQAPDKVDGDLFERFPFVLQIEAVEVAVFVVIIDDAPCGGAGLVAIGMDRENQGGGIDGGVLFGENKTATRSVLVVEFVAGVKSSALVEAVESDE